MLPSVDCVVVVVDSLGQCLDGKHDPLTAFPAYVRDDLQEFVTKTFLGHIPVGQCFFFHPPYRLSSTAAESPSSPSPAAASLFKAKDAHDEMQAAPLLPSILVVCVARTAAQFQEDPLYVYNALRSVLLRLVQHNNKVAKQEWIQQQLQQRQATHSSSVPPLPPNHSAPVALNCSTSSTLPQRPAPPPPSDSSSSAATSSTAAALQANVGPISPGTATVTPLSASYPTVAVEAPPSADLTSVFSLSTSVPSTGFFIPPTSVSQLNTSLESQRMAARYWSPRKARCIKVVACPLFPRLGSFIKTGSKGVRAVAKQMASAYLHCCVIPDTLMTESHLNTITATMNDNVDLSKQENKVQLTRLYMLSHTHTHREAAISYKETTHLCAFLVHVCVCVVGGVAWVGWVCVFSSSLFLFLSHCHRFWCMFVSVQSLPV